MEKTRQSTYMVKESGGAETLLRSPEWTLWMLQAAGHERSGEHQYSNVDRQAKCPVGGGKGEEREKRHTTTFKQKQKECIPQRQNGDVC